MTKAEAFDVRILRMVDDNNLLITCFQIESQIFINCIRRSVAKVFRKKQSAYLKGHHFDHLLHLRHTESCSSPLFARRLFLSE